MKYSGYLLSVKDIQKSKRFYQDVVGATVYHDLGDYIIFHDGYVLLQENTWREFLGHDHNAVSYGHHSGELFFEEDDIDTFVQRLMNFQDITIISPLAEYPWGQRVIRFSDPDGHLLEVGESMKVVVKRYLKKGMSIVQAAEKSMFPLEFVKECAEELQ